MVKKFFGGADRIRTGGLMNATHALYQLSYSPKKRTFTTLFLVELTGFEPVTS